VSGEIQVMTVGVAIKIVTGKTTGNISHF
jgi:hypothetical protein